MEQSDTFPWITKREEKQTVRMMMSWSQGGEQSNPATLKLKIQIPKGKRNSLDPKEGIS
jgi:hypothetical protein